MDLTRKLAKFASNMTFEALPSEVIEVAKQCLMDWWAVTAVGAMEPAATIVRKEALADGLVRLFQV